MWSRTERLLDIINRYPNGVSRTDLLRRAWRFVNAGELTEATDTLVQAGMVRAEAVETSENRLRTT